MVSRRFTEAEETFQMDAFSAAISGLVAHPALCRPQMEAAVAGDLESQMEAASPSPPGDGEEMRYF